MSIEYYSANILSVNLFVDFHYEKLKKISLRCSCLGNSLKAAGFGGEKGRKAASQQAEKSLRGEFPEGSVRIRRCLPLLFGRLRRGQRKPHFLAFEFRNALRNSNVRSGFERGESALCVQIALGPPFPAVIFRLIWAAMYPAPKPLSMFTTLTPSAQELSMVRRGASPPKEAP